MPKQTTKKDTATPPISLREMNRILLLLLVVMAIIAGYFHARFSNEEKKYNRLLLKYRQLLEDTDGQKLMSPPPVIK